jgi:1,4-dihydroxy-2-naphthoyl-CoA hydrolase
MASIVTRALAVIERRMPRGASRVKRWFVQYLVPFNRRIGLHIEYVAPDSSEVVLRLPARRGNRNVGGTIHGGAIMALAESVHGVAVLWQFPPARHLMFAKESRIEFLAPARGELTVSFSLEPAVRDRIASELEANGRCLIELVSVVKARDGTDIARLTATYHLRRIR